MVLFGVLVMFQTFSLPGQFAHMAEESPDLAYLRWPLTALAVFWVLCVQVVDRVHLAAAHAGHATTASSAAASLAWVDAIVGAVGAAWLLLVARVPVRRVQGGRSRACRCCCSCSWSAAPSSGC